MDLKYIVVGQRLDLAYEGRHRRFTVIQILDQEEISEAIESVIDGVHSLSIEPCVRLCLANWDTQIRLV